MDAWSRRLLATLILVGVAHALQFFPLPWLLLDAWGVPTVLGGWFIVARESSQFSVAALGLVPFVSGLGLTTFVFAVVPKLHRSLDLPAGETRVLRVGLWVSALLALLQSIGIGLFMQSVSSEMAVDEQDPWLMGSTLWLFATLYAALPFALERWGLGRGLSAAVVLYCLMKLAAAFHAIGFDWLVATAKPVHVGDVAMVPVLVLATVGATRRWVGDVQVLPGDPRLDRVGRGLSIALIVLVALNGLGLTQLVRLASLGEFGEHVLTLSVTVGGGLLLASRRGASDAQRFAGGQLLALGSFVLFAASAVMLLAGDRLVMPWAECVIATMLIYMTWREAQTDSGSGSDSDSVAASPERGS